MKRVPIVIPKVVRPTVNKPYGYIYMTYDTVNGKWYIGKKEKPRFVPTYYGSGVVIHRIAKIRPKTLIVKPIDWASSKEELNEKEKWWIAYFNAVESTGFYNKLAGGDGYSKGDTAGIKNFNYGKTGYMKGKHHTDNTKKLISDRMKGENNPRYGVKLTETEVQKIRDTIPRHDGKYNPKCKQIVQLSLDDSFIRVWDYLKQAHIELHISEECIRDTCKNKREHFAGYKWMYLEDYISQGGKIDD